MFTIYVRISDLLNLEDRCPPRVEETVTVHIVADPAWAPSSDGQTMVACAEALVADVRVLLPGVQVVGKTPEQLAQIQKQFGC